MEKFNLKWNDFQVNVSKSFGLLRNEKYLQDIALVSEDLQVIQAHKLVLSACSEYFRNILQLTNSGSQTLLCLDGVNAEDMRNVLDYVYEGEVKIAQEDLDRFLNVAQKLKLEGLISDGEASDETRQEDEEFEKLKPDESLPLPMPVSNFKQPRTRPAMKAQDNGVVSIINDNGAAMSEEDHRQRLVDNVQINEDGSASCKVCGKTFTGQNLGVARGNARRHVEIHIEGLSYNCSHCDKTFRSKNTLTSHRPCHRKP